MSAAEGKLRERARQAASDWVYSHTTAWKGKSPEFMQTQVNRLTEIIANERRAELLKAAESICSDCASGNKPVSYLGDLIHKGTEIGSWSGESKQFSRLCKAAAIRRRAE